MAAGPPVAYVYSPEYAALCDSLCKVPKRVGCRGVGLPGLGERGGGSPAGGGVRGPCVRAPLWGGSV